MDNKQNLSEKIDEKLFSLKQPKIKDKKLRELVHLTITVSVMVLLTVMIWDLGVSHPNMILITGVVVFTSLFGFISGGVAALDVIIYSIIFFVNKQQALENIIVTLIGTLFCLFFVGFLHKYNGNTLKQLETANLLLQQDVTSLEKAALTDQLTKIGNRMAFRSDYETYEGKFVYLMIIDIDNFKHVNDFYGHSAGDYALKIMSKVLKKVFNDDKCYRYGGDEFLVISAKEDRPPQEFARLAAQLKQQIKDLYFNKSDFELHFSAGYVYGYVETHEDLRYMVGQADKKLYEAKNSGKNTICSAEYSRETAKEILGHIVRTDDNKK